METKPLKFCHQYNTHNGCQNGSTCKYLHPNKNCKKFPRCEFDTKCRYNHWISEAINPKKAFYQSSNYSKSADIPSFGRFEREASPNPFIRGRELREELQSRRTPQKDYLRELNTLKEKHERLAENHENLKTNYKKVNDELTRLKRNYKDLNAYFNGLKNDYDDLNKYKASLRSQISDLKHDNNVLETKHKKLWSNYNALNAEKIKAEEKVKVFKLSSSMIEAEHRDTITTLQNTIDKLLAGNDNTVGKNKGKRSSSAVVMVKPEDAILRAPQKEKQAILREPQQTSSGEPTPKRSYKHYEKTVECRFFRLPNPSLDDIPFISKNVIDILYDNGFTNCYAINSNKSTIINLIGEKLGTATGKTRFFRYVNEWCIANSNK